MKGPKEKHRNALLREGIAGRHGTNDGPQESQHGELGRPSRPFSVPTGQTRQVGQLGDQFDRIQVELIVCKKCRKELRSFVDAMLHSC